MLKLFKNILVTVFIIQVVQCALPRPAAEKIIVADIFGDNMVLQRSMKVAVWGTAKPGGKITISMNGSSVSENTRTDGNWRFYLPKMDGGLKTRDGKMAKKFAIAGADQKFDWVDATIEDNSVVLCNNEIISPVAIRYAWADSPEYNLINSVRLPAVPFRTDDWTAITKRKNEY